VALLESQTFNLYPKMSPAGETPPVKAFHRMVIVVFEESCCTFYKPVGALGVSATPAMISSLAGP
jgi:hypothetical protein